MKCPAISENWVDIAGCGGLYQVSDLGRIRGLNRTDTIGRRVSGRILKGGVNNWGYRQVRLRRNGNKARLFCVHRIVAEIFIGPCPEGHEVNHKNGTKLDNRPVNLEYVTPKENVAHAYKLGLISLPSGPNPMSKLIPSEVVAIRKLYGKGKRTQAEIARQFHVTPSAISKIVLRRSWAYVL